MDRFDRITPQRADKPGQAFIRNTDITVTEVVKLVVGGKRVDEVLAQYDELEIEDVHQALAYAVSDLRELIGFWRMEILNPLTSVNGYAKVLNDILQANPNNFTYLGEKVNLADISKIIYNNGQSAQSYVQYMNMLSQFYTESHYTSLKYSVADIREFLATHLEIYSDGASIKFEIPKSIPALHFDFRLNYAILILVLPAKFNRLFSPDAILRINKSSENHVRFEIDRYITPEYKEHPPYYWHKDILHTFDPHMPFTIAFRTIRAHGTELHYDIHDDSVTFSFELPIWKDDET